MPSPSPDRTTRVPCRPRTESAAAPPPALSRCGHRRRAAEARASPRDKSRRRTVGQAAGVRCRRRSNGRRAHARRSRTRSGMHAVRLSDDASRARAGLRRT